MDDLEDSEILRVAGAVEEVDRGQYRARLSEIYTVAGHPHGGYLQTVVASAALAAASAEGAPHLHASAVTTNYVGASEPGVVSLGVEVRRVGRGASFAHVTMRQNE
ncbi:MAG TPA: acyl-CoA thioesterase domain-containing protein [Acidimicrobiales bacterium]|nr:acyl-CoA thioesterase domain-containing protein [Acidimicrobiales bacterium]